MGATGPFAGPRGERPRACRAAHLAAAHPGHPGGGGPRPLGAHGPRARRAAGARLRAAGRAAARGGACGRDARPVGLRAAARRRGELERVRLACAQSAAAQAAAPRLLAPGRREVDVLTELGSVHARSSTTRGRSASGAAIREFFFGHVLGGPQPAARARADRDAAGPVRLFPAPRAAARRGACSREGDAVVVDICGYARRATCLTRRGRSRSAGSTPAWSRPTPPAARILAELVPLLLTRHAGDGAVRARCLELATEAGFGEHFMGHGPTPRRASSATASGSSSTSRRTWLTASRGAHGAWKRGGRRAQARVPRGSERSGWRTRTSWARTGPRP